MSKDHRGLLKSSILSYTCIYAKFSKMAAWGNLYEFNYPSQNSILFLSTPNSFLRK